MADDKTTKTPEQPVTDSGPGKETPPAPPKEPEKVSVSPEPEKKTEPEVKNPQVSVYNFAEIMKEKKAEERAAAPGGEKPDPAKAEKPEKQPEAPKKAEEKPKEPEQPKRRGRPPKADKDKAAAPKPKAPAQKPEKAVKKEPEKKTAPTVQTAPTPKEPEKPKDAPRRGKEQIVYIKLNELHAFKNHPFEVRDDEEMRAMVSSVKDKGVTQPAIVRPREDGGYEIVSGHRRQKASELAGYADMPCIVRNLTDDEAITQMVEDNLNQREEILPSERAKALKMQLEARGGHLLAPPLVRQSDIGVNGQRRTTIRILTDELKVDKVQRLVISIIMRCLSTHGQQIRAACLIIGHIPGNLIRDGRVAVAIHICEYRFERLDRFCRPLPQYISIANRLNHRFKRSVCSFKRCELIVILVVVLDSMHNNLPRINRPADAA